MRTTLDIADDVLLAAKEVAQREKTSVGTALSNLARQALTMPSQRKGRKSVSTADRLAAMGFYPLPHRGGVVTNELINRIRDEEGI